jgi:hypothetical protein
VAGSAASGAGFPVSSGFICPGSGKGFGVSQLGIHFQ